MNTLAIFYPGCIGFEIFLACEILNKKFPVKVATPDGSGHLDSNGMTVRADFSFQELNPDEYKIVLIPGGDPGILIGNKHISEILQACHKNNSIISAICAGPLVLEQAGLLKNRKIAHGYKASQIDFLNKNGFFKNTILTDEAFIIDDNIVTAKPDAFIDFAVETGILVGVIASEKKEFWKEYYRGRK